MKKILSLFLLISTITNAQYTIKGSLMPNYKSNWVILYKLEGSRQKYIQNTNVTIDSILIDNQKQAVASFNFTLPKDAKKGMYRLSYETKGAGYLDFIFNNENVSVSFNPYYPDQSSVFSESKENKVYNEFLIENTTAQKKLDSIQFIGLKNPSINVKQLYSEAYKNVMSIFNRFIKQSEGMIANDFIKATKRKNAEQPFVSSQEYLNYVVNNFFVNMDFSNPNLKNSSFLLDRISDYIFYLNYSSDKLIQQKLYKKSINEVVRKVSDIQFKKSVLEFLIKQFEDQKNVEIVDFLFDTHYAKLPQNLIDTNFKSKALNNLLAEVGRIAPDFSWKSLDGKNYKLSTLAKANNYLLIFWSTSCSHCLREIPVVYDFMKNKNNVKVVAFAMEKNDADWKSYSKKLNGWYNVVGLNKWENKTARTYQIYSTPSYFILDANKKIIAKPEKIEEVKAFFEPKN